MKKIPVQVTDENVKFMLENDLSFSKVMNSAIDNLRTVCSHSKMENKDEKVQILHNLQDYKSNKR